MLQIVASLIDAPRGVIYNCHMVIVQATGVMLQIVALCTDNSIGIIYDINMFIVQATDV